MRTIIAGSRTITDFAEVEKAIKDSGFTITQVICGGAEGVDAQGLDWAVKNNVTFTFFFPDWDTHGKAAGPIRNAEMAKNADALILVWDGQSRGSKDMLNKATAAGLKIYTHIVKRDEDENER